MTVLILALLGFFILIKLNETVEENISEIYIIGIFIAIIWKQVDFQEPLSILMLVLSVYIWVLYYLSGKKKIVSKKSLLVVALIPVIIKSIISINTVYIWNYNTNNNEI